MLVENVTFRYYRCIPRGFRDCVRQRSREDYRGEDKPKKAWSGKLLRQSHHYRRHRGWTQHALWDVPPDPRGGITECLLEVYDDSDESKRMVFVSRVRCSNKDIFCYKTGREMARTAAYQQYNEYLSQETE